MKRFKDLTDEEINRIVRIAVIVGIFILVMVIFFVLQSRIMTEGDIPPRNQTDPHMTPWS